MRCRKYICILSVCFLVLIYSISSYGNGNQVKIEVKGKNRNGDDVWNLRQGFVVSEEGYVLTVLNKNEFGSWGESVRIDGKESVEVFKDEQLSLAVYRIIDKAFLKDLKSYKIKPIKLGEFFDIYENMNVFIKKEDEVISGKVVSVYKKSNDGRLDVSLEKKISKDEIGSPILNYKNDAIAIITALDESKESIKALPISFANAMIIGLGIYPEYRYRHNIDLDIIKYELSRSSISNLEFVFSENGDLKASYVSTFPNAKKPNSASIRIQVKFNDGDDDFYLLGQYDANPPEDPVPVGNSNNMTFEVTFNAISQMIKRFLNIRKNNDEIPNKYSFDAIKYLKLNLEIKWVKDFVNNKNFLDILNDGEYNNTEFVWNRELTKTLVPKIIDGDIIHN